MHSLDSPPIDRFTRMFAFFLASVLEDAETVFNISAFSSNSIPDFHINAPGLRLGRLRCGKDTD